MKRMIALALLLVAGAAHADDVTASDVLDFDIVKHGDAFVVRDDAYELTFVNSPQLSAQQAPTADGRVLSGAVLVDDPVPGGGDAGSGAVIVSMMPVPADVAFDGGKGMLGTRDGVLKGLGTVATHSERDVTFGGLKGREFRASGVRDRTRWTFRMFAAWDVPHRTLISIFAIYGPLAPKTAPAALDAFVKAFKSKPGHAPRPRTK